MVSAAANEAPILFAPLFLCRLFLVAVLGNSVLPARLLMGQEGGEEGRPSVTTINHPDAIFAGTMEKLARPAPCIRYAYTFALT